MRMFYLSFKRLKEVWFALLSLAVVGSLIVHSFWHDSAPVSSKNPSSPIVYRVQTEEKVVALTFDISWGTQTPPKVLNLLRKEGLRCTFFLSGPWARRYPDLAQHIAKDGHEIASHGHRHINLSSLPPSEIKAEIGQAHEALKEVTGHAPNLIRTPNGDYNGKVLKVAQEMGYRVIQWDVDSLDWKNPGVNTIVSRVLKQVRPGSIVLLHASDTCQQTDQALPAIIQGLREKGYSMVTVSELLQYGPGVAE
ncbi:polysaccharide deacetylase family sporulation protein PdaB [Desulfothermobacter acidiphilus]|uniref:polysaccharide deacetylase family sporulation protein PdaB n=1 Tax=Desulfothermobacter acidiphilus TaxID=1938353 RepID=UPI003F8C7EE0